MTSESTDRVHDVVVVGAGAAGLAVAGLLDRAGADVLVLEARDRIGGRLLSAPAPGGVVDLGATWYWDGEDRIDALVERFGLETFNQHLAGDTVVEDLDRIQRLPGNRLDVPALRYGAGAVSVASALAAGLPVGRVRLGEPVERVGFGDHGRAAVTSRGGTHHTRHVVIALPPALAVASIDFAPALPEALARLARRTPVWMGDTIKVVATYPTPFWRDLDLAGAAFSWRGPLREIHDMSGPGGRPAALFGFAQATGRDEDIAESARGQLGRLFGPSAPDPTEVLVQDWSRERWTSPPRTGEPTDRSVFGHPAYQRPAQGGRLHWAGTETAPLFAGHVEGALEAGERAAAAVLGALPATTDTDSAPPVERSAR